MLTKKQVLLIPKLSSQGLTRAQIAEALHSTPRTISNWITKLRKQGYDIPKVSPPGRTPLLSTPEM